MKIAENTFGVLPVADGFWPLVIPAQRLQIQCMEIVFSVTQEADGGFVAECLSHDIFTQGNNWEQLRKNVQEAVSAYFFDQPKPAHVRFQQG